MRFLTICMCTIGNRRITTVAAKHHNCSTYSLPIEGCVVVQTQSRILVELYGGYLLRLHTAEVRGFDDDVVRGGDCELLRRRLRVNCTRRASISINTCLQAYERNTRSETKRGKVAHSVHLPVGGLALLIAISAADFAPAFLHSPQRIAESASTLIPGPNQTP